MRTFLLTAALGLTACYQPSRLIDPALYAPLAGHPLHAPDPSQSGSFAVRRLYYGSGTDRRRIEYRDSVAIRTPSVNATPFLKGADPTLLPERWKYWGFDAKRLPINGRVWYPEGEGPFPLVLIVHGNHNMREFSDPGYGYLGELLASRGYIFASVDENFLNGNLRTENDARGWMLLQHLVAWRRFNADSTTPFFKKVDVSRIALMGHSRGGEAVAVAAAFNRLSRYPDDARVVFQFGFQIQTLVAIAPVDGQYRPADQGTPLSDVNYLVLHGTHDSDVSTFMGQRQYQRVQFSGAGAWRKSAVYIYRANHGQFNTVWGSSDVGPERGLLLQKRNLLSGDAQRQVGKVFISAFLDLTLRGATAYEPLFRDARQGGEWLPSTIYLTRYEDAKTTRLATFEEDVDVSTGTVSGVHITGVGLTAWRELGLSMRSRGNLSYENHVVRLGWSASKDDTAHTYYDVSWSDETAAAVRFDSESAVVFEVEAERERPKALAVADTAPATGPMARPPLLPWLRTLGQKRARDVADQDSVRALDLTVELRTRDGVIARVPLSELSPLPPPLTIRLYKWKTIERRFGAASRDYDQVLTRYAIPLGALERRLSGFTATNLRTVRFVFDRSASGSVLLDGIGVERSP